MTSRRTGWLGAVPAVAVGLLLLAGYARWSGCREEGTSDCGLQIRIAGVLYNDSGSTPRVATRYATADWADCEDVGRCARGSVFPEDPRRVQAWSFDGYSPEQVVGVRRNGSFTVFVADSATPAERRRIARELSRPVG